MRYFMYKNKVLYPDDFLPRDRTKFYRTKNGTSWDCFEHGRKWHGRKWIPCSNPTQHGIYLEELTREELFIEML